MTYASETSVSSDKSRSEIERILVRYGADQFMYGWGDGSAIVAFRSAGKHVKFLLPMPDREAREFTWTPGGRQRRNPAQQEAAYEQTVRQRWRALKLVIQAKLEAVEAGITTFEDEFLAHLVLPSGETFGEWAAPQLERAYITGAMPSSLLGLPAPRIVEDGS